MKNKVCGITGQAADSRFRVAIINTLYAKLICDSLDFILGESADNSSCGIKINMIVIHHKPHSLAKNPVIHTGGVHIQRQRQKFGVGGRVPTMYVHYTCAICHRAIKEVGLLDYSCYLRPYYSMFRSASACSSRNMHASRRHISYLIGE